MTDQGSFTALGLRPRVAARHKLFEPVVLRKGGVAARAHMLDLSVSGARLHAERPPVAGARILIEADGLAVTAHVIWVRAKRFGVHFDTPIAEEAMRLVLRGPPAPLR